MVTATLIIVAVTTFLALFLSLTIGFSLSKNITVPLETIMKTSRVIAGIDILNLTNQMQTLSRGDVKINLKIKSKLID
ncbi:MAG TPA: hypothetical protein PLO89_05870, partial [Spirochaetota bacterium]|nr:hypothetical protein [Spirochaetota bacterium]